MDLEVGPAYDTYWKEFSFADMFGMDAVKDEYGTVFEIAKKDYVYLTDFVMVLNHKIWYWYEKNKSLAKLYDDLWRQADEYACTNLSGNELTYFLRMTD